jgi:hypothetical protein
MFDDRRNERDRPADPAGLLCFARKSCFDVARLLCRHWLNAGSLLKELNHLARLGMAACGKLAIDQMVIYGDFKPPPRGGEQGDGFDGRSVLLQNLVRQTDGAG